MKLKEMQAEVDRWLKPFGYWHPLANLARLTEEVGELAREVNHRWGPKTKKPTEETGDLALEMGDILFVVAAMANQMNIDLEEAFRRVIAKYEQRDANRWQRQEPNQEL
ncbi:MAG TPA: nucleotide pyrophosphohydrolase [Symbiobacteriaceae bacterium]|jgi:NTP pyrophosphatase (non-canonical NTP hydrolase)